MSQLNFGDGHARCRQSNLRAWAALQPQLSNKRGQVFHALVRMRRPASAKMIARHLGVERDLVHNRLSELRRQGVVEEVGERTCEVTEQSVIHFAPADNPPGAPIPLEKRTPKADRIAALEARVTELERILGGMR